MGKKLEYKFNHKQKIIIETISGKIKLNELIELEKTKLNDPGHNDSYSIIIDIRGAVFEINAAERETFYKMLEELTANINMNRKCAFITQRPNEVVNSVLFKLRVNEFAPMNFEIFSSEEAAYAWVKQ